LKLFYYSSNSPKTDSTFSDEVPIPVHGVLAFLSIQLFVEQCVGGDYGTLWVFFVCELSTRPSSPVVPPASTPTSMRCQPTNTVPTPGQAVFPSGLVIPCITTLGFSCRITNHSALTLPGVIRPARDTNPFTSRSDVHYFYTRAILRRPVRIF